MRRYIISLIIILLCLSCSPTIHEDEAFEREVEMLEDNPQLFINHTKKQASYPIKNKKEATDFLMISLAKNYANKNYFPTEEDLLKCISIFEKHKLISQQLEALFLLAKLYKIKKNMNEEVASIQKAISLATKKEDDEWMFCLYNYLGNMYIREYNLVILR